MSNNNLGTSAKIILVVSIFMVALFYSMVDIQQKNTILDDKSEVLINNLNSNYNNNDYDGNFVLSSNNLTNDSSTLGIDPFYRQAAEDKQDISTFGNTVKNIVTFPALFLMIFGINETMANVILGLFVSFLLFMLALQGYKALRTGEVDS